MRELSSVILENLNLDKNSNFCTAHFTVISLFFIDTESTK